MSVAPEHEVPDRGSLDDAHVSPSTPSPSRPRVVVMGVPLTDDDRWPWLTLVGEWLAEQSGGGVIACSALKRAYRDRIRAAAPDTVFVHLHGSRELMGARMAARPGHFMPTSLLDSQFATLELLGDDEAGRVFDVAVSPVRITDEAAAWLRG